MPTNSEVELRRLKELARSDAGRYMQNLVASKIGKKGWLCGAAGNEGYFEIRLRHTHNDSFQARADIEYLILAARLVPALLKAIDDGGE